MASSSTFQYIVEHILHLADKSNKSNVFSHTYRPNHVNALQKQTFKTLLNKLTNSRCRSEIERRRQKQQVCFDIIHDFYFASNDQAKQEFLSYFCKVQGVYNAFTKLALIYKCKRAMLSVTTDLQLNDIAIGQRNVVSIYHANTKFLFRLEDLLKIVFTSLTNTYMFFAEPIMIRNPYNNLPFGKSILYHIYFFFIMDADLRYIQYEHINVFLKFKQCNFDLSRFIDMNTSLLREYAIDNYITNSTKQQLQSDILRFIKQYNAGKSDGEKILIDIEFPVDTLISIMKPYLMLYIQSMYALTYAAQQNAKKRMYNKLQLFQEFNPAFGKRTVIFKYMFVNGVVKRIKSHIEFNCKCCRFSDGDSDRFLSNHLTYTYVEENDSMQADVGNMYFAEDEDEDADEDEDEDAEQEQEQEQNQEQEQDEEQDGEEEKEEQDGNV